MIITIDCGATNMRCRLFDNNKPIDEVKRTAGCRNTAFTGSDDFLRVSLRESVNELLERNKLSESDIEIIISSGTLATDVGIYRVPHSTAPIGVRESARDAKKVVLEDITSIPILFIPGVKTLPEDDETDEVRVIELLESMSGEECETYGIMKMLDLHGDFVITLPGSYNKALEIDSDGRITSIRTGMCGEFIAAMAEHTLLRHSLPHPVIREILPDFLYRGFDYSSTHGVSPSLIKARTVQLLRNWTADEAANFFIGAILLDDIKSTYELCGEDRLIVVGGSNPLRHIFTLLLSRLGARNILEIDDETARLSNAVGAIEVYNLTK